MKKWTYKSDSKLKGAYGETDYEKRLIRINKKAHKKKTLRRITPNKDGSENMLTSMLHEITHKNHPKMHEKGTEKLARAMKSKMSKKQKSKIYSKFK